MKPPKSRSITQSVMQVPPEVAAAIDEAIERLARGEQVCLEELCERFPHSADEIRNVFPCLNALAELRPDDSVVGADDEAQANTILSSQEKVLGDFRILRELGRGGMGVVYEAEELSLRRRVALKVLPFAALLSPRHLERFRNEARAAAMLKHPNIVSVHSVGNDRGVHFYAMELVEGASLAEVISRLHAGGGLKPDDAKEKTLAGERLQAYQDTEPVAHLSTLRSSNRTEYFRSVAQLGIDAARALQFAHESGVIHRDVKPSNILLDTEGKLHIADFGLARILESDSLTMSGDIVGTLRYMSPEQVEGQIADARGDIYSLGATLFELSTLRPVFVQTEPRALRRAILNSTVVSPAAVCSDIPRDLANIIRKCLDANPGQRYRNGDDLADDLERFLNHQAVQARPSSRLHHLRYFAKRNPRTALLVASVLVLLVLSVVTSSLLALNFRQLARVEREHLVEARANARLQRLGLYARDIRLAQKAAEDGRILDLQEILLKWAKDGHEDARGFEWFHLWQYCEDPSVVRTLYHELPVRQAVFLNGDQVATSNFAHELPIWRLDRSIGQPESNLQMPSNVVYHLSRHSGSGRLAAGNHNGDIRVWHGDQVRMTPCFTMNLASEHVSMKKVRSIAFDRGGHHLCVGTGDETHGNVHVLDVDSGRVTHRLDVASAAVAAFAHDGQLYVGSRNSDQILVHGSNHWEMTKAHAIDASGINKLLANRDGTQIAFVACREANAARSFRIEIRRTSDWDRVWAFELPSRCHSMAFSEDGCYFSWGDATGTAWILNLDHPSGSPQLELREKLHGATINDVCFSPDGQRLLTASADNLATVWDLESLRNRNLGTTSLQVPRELRYATGACFADESHTVAVANRMLGTFLGNAQSGNEQDRFDGPSPDQTYVPLAAAPRKGLVSMAGGYYPWPDDPDATSRLLVRDVKNLNRVIVDTEIPSVGTSPTSSAMSPNGQFVAICSHRQGIIVVDVSNPESRQKLPTNCKTVRFSADGRTLAGGDYKGNVHLYSVPEFDHLETVPMDDRVADCVDLSSDGRFVAAVGFDRRVKIHDRRSGTTREFERMSGFPNLVRFSPDGQRVVTGGLDGSLRLWSVESGDELLRWQYSADSWPTGEFSMDGTRFVVGGYFYCDVIHAPSADILRKLSVSELRSRACQCLPESQSEDR